MDYYNTTDTYNITMDTYNITTKILWKYYSHLQVYRPAVPTQHYMTLQSLLWLRVLWESLLMWILIHIWNFQFATENAYPIFILSLVYRPFTLSCLFLSNIMLSHLTPDYDFLPTIWMSAPFLIDNGCKHQPFYLIRATLSFIRLCSFLHSIIWHCIAGCSVSPCRAVSSSYFRALYNPYFILGTMSPSVFIFRVLCNSSWLL